VNDIDRRLTAALTTEQNRCVADLTAPGGPAARATVSRRRRRAAATVVGALVLTVAAGAGLAQGDDESRLVSAAPPARSPASPAPADQEARIDCDGRPVAPDGPVSTWDVRGPMVALGDVSGDGREEQAAVAHCSVASRGEDHLGVVILTGRAPNMIISGPFSEFDRGTELTALSYDDAHKVLTVSGTVGGNGHTRWLSWDGTHLVPLADSQSDGPANGTPTPGMAPADGPGDGH
jgi:hypothetical protein